ncbi:MAG: hypothetical protein JSR94_18000 [Proteobacteria bacterium]|nr:hypothetical protein [Pseudomonadota bacterium]
MDIRRAALFAGMASMLLAVTAGAGVSYTFATDCAAGTGASLSCANGRLGVSAWSNTVGTANRYIENATVVNYGSYGLGITNADSSLPSGADAGEGTSPEHAIDNNGRYDALLLDFGAGNQFGLTGFRNGWYSTDSDMSFLAYTGSGDALAGLASRTLSFGDAASDPASLLNNGWTRVSDYADAGTVARSLTAGVASRYWLVSTYVPMSATYSLSVGNDYVKLAAIEGSYLRQVPLPATWWLLVPGLLWLYRLRSRRV